MCADQHSAFGDQYYPAIRVCKCHSPASAQWGRDMDSATSRPFVQASDLPTSPLPSAQVSLPQAKKERLSKPLFSFCRTRLTSAPRPQCQFPPPPADCYLACPTKFTQASSRARQPSCSEFIRCRGPTDYVSPPASHPRNANELVTR